MEQLLKIGQGQIGDALAATVNARDLHAFLEVGKDFSDWIKDRIVAYDFVENHDFVVSAEIGENPLGGRPAKEYHLSIDMAKELSMIERNEKGKQARRYFIECERLAKDASTINVPQTLPEALRLAADLAEEIMMHKAKIAALKPHSDALKRIALSSTWRT